MEVYYTRGVFMKLNIMYVLFVFFTYKQQTMDKHYVGSDKDVFLALRLFSYINKVLEYVYIVYYAINVSIIRAIILHFVTYVFQFVMAIIVYSVAKRKTLKNIEINDPLYHSKYNYNCDFINTKIAIIGIPINVLIVLIFFMI